MLNVLIIAESFLTRLGLRQFFKDEYSAPKFGEAKTGEQGMLTFFERRWDLVILDTDLPDQSGLYLFTALDSQREWTSKMGWTKTAVSATVG